MSQPAAAPVRRSLWIPGAFVAFFLVVFAANGTMIWYATRTFVGLDTSQAYDKGIAYNRNLDAAAAQAALGWKAAIEARITEGFDALVTLRLTDADGQSLGDVRATLLFERPSNTALDFSAPLVPDGEGGFLARVTLPEIGLWDLHVTATRDDALMVFDRRVMLR